MGSGGATLLGSFSGATGEIAEAGIVWSDNSALLDDPVTNSLSLNWEYDDSCIGDVESGDISTELTGLDASETYYYKAFVSEYNEQTSSYEYRFGDLEDFTTTAAVGYTAAGWLELPAVSGSEDFVGKFYGSGSTAGTNRNYSYYYNYTYYASLWVDYPLCSTHKTGSASTTTWRYNPNVSTTPTNRQVKVRSSDGSYTSMYGNSTYSRGHQCPNASRKCDDDMNKQTYYVTNQTPQRQTNFNASIWGALEGAVRDLTNNPSDTVYVATGPVYRTASGSETINYLTGAAGKGANPSSLPIPNYYWKALLKVKRNGSGDVTSASAIGFWFEHRDYNSATESYDQFAVSVDQIEAWTGFDLFTNLPSPLQTTAEANTSWSSLSSF